MHSKVIQWFGRQCRLVCDGRCDKAWGINSRPNIAFDPNEPDDTAWLADGELGEAPADPGTYEGGYAKPSGPDDMNKWCSRECERSRIVEEGESITLPRFEKRLYNIPWLHEEEKR